MRHVIGALSVAVPVGILATDPAGDLWFANQRWVDLSGCPERAFRGRPWYETLHPDDRDRAGTQWRAQRIHHGRVEPFRARSANGTLHECVVDTIPMVGEGDVVTDYFLIIRDAHEPPSPGGLTNEAMLDSLMNRSQDVVTILNPDATWRWSSAGAMRLIGHQVEYDPADGIFPFIHPDERESIPRRNSPGWSPPGARARSASSTGSGWPTARGGPWRPWSTCASTTRRCAGW